MKLSDLSIRRPVFAMVVSLLLVVLGGMSFMRLTLRELPNIDPPIVSVEVRYPGASAAVVETRVTQILEDGLAGIEGIRTIQSQSRNGRADVTIVSRVMDRLPDEADPPEIAKVEADADVIIWLNMRSTVMDTMELTDYADRYVVDRLSALDGVARVQLGGAQRYAMRIWFNPARLSAYGLTPSEVRAALARENVELPSGKISGNATELSIRTFGRLTTEEDFNNVIIKTINGNDITILDT